MSLMPGQALTRLMGERGLLKELSVRPTSAIKGQLLPEVHTNLSALDIKGAFAACQDAEPGAPDEGDAVRLTSPKCFGIFKCIFSVFCIF